MAQLKASDFQVVHNRNSKSEIVVINTCGFIKDAKQESIDTILQYVDAKQKGLINKLYVMGCLSERYKNELIDQIPEVDQYFGVKNLQEIIKEVGGNYRDELVGERVLTTPTHFAYLKISEGCNRKCTFCAIPGIRGKHRSKPIESILAEAKRLSAKGVKEVMLIAQDLSFYGMDLYRKHLLHVLIDELTKIEGIEWIRLHYAYPAGFPESVLSLIRDKEKICKYLDIPIQHINNRILNLMQRGYSKEETLHLLLKIREEVPGITIRTTLIVGFPGETRQEFEELIDFVRDFKFDRLGVFPYSHEEGTSAFKLRDNIPAKVKIDRMEHLMNIQQAISLELNETKVGKVFKTIIDRREGDYYIGRTECDSPEIDNEVVINSKQSRLKSGKFYPVLISKADYFDVFGNIVD
jgi:ribosomal protein S12 methylthiotransferase